MTSIIIVDQNKPSLVMTSEVFKDHLPGVFISVATTGTECVQLVEKDPNVAMIVIDFDLPDTDGITLTQFLRKTYNGPILITAYPEVVVEKAIRNELFLYADASSWVSKPVKADVLIGLIERFLTNKQRFRRRFLTDLPAIMVGKGAGRGKRAPKVSGMIKNLGIGGALIETSKAIDMKAGDEITIVLGNLHTDNDAGKKKPKIEDIEKDSGTDNRVRATIAWTSRTKNKAGIQFVKLSDFQRRKIEEHLKDAEEIP